MAPVLMVGAGQGDASIPNRHASRFMKRILPSSIFLHLLTFGIALVLPVLVFAGVLVWQFAEAESQRYEYEARDAAHRIAAAVDRELTGILATAQALAASASLMDGDYEAFHRQALATLRSWSPDRSDIYAIVVRDVSGQQVVNTSLSQGAALPKGGDLQIDRIVIETKRPYIRDLFVSATAGRPMVSIRVPVLKDDQVIHVIAVALEPRRFAEALRSQNLPPEWTAALIDRADRIVARARQHEAFVGKLATEDLRRNAIADEGIWMGYTQEGFPVLAAYARSTLTGWRAAVGVRVEFIQQPLMRSLWAIAALGLVLVALSSLVALRLGRRIATPVHALAERARVLGTGGFVAPLDTGLAEIDEVGDALATASSKLRQREASLRESEGRLRATQENAAVGIAEVDRDGRFVYVNEARCKLTGHSRAELLGLHFTHANYGPDMERDLALFARQIAGELDVYTIEKQHVLEDGARGWTRVSSSAVRDSLGRFLYAVRVVEDVTERKQAEERQKLLVDELNHRVKNTLATVQSLAWQSLRQGLPPETARERFEGRLLALSRTHNLLNESGWEGASLRTILRIELEPYGAELQQFVLIGQDLDLLPRVAVALGMAFHELATNAIKHGALSVSTGRVLVEWWAEDQGECATLEILWREVDGPAIRPPSSAGFGTRLLRQTIERELAGSLDVQYPPEGLICRMRIRTGETMMEAAE